MNLTDSSTAEGNEANSQGVGDVGNGVWARLFIERHIGLGSRIILRAILQQVPMSTTFRRPRDAR
jgi:hypothetical protein